ncbi:MAG: long-chain-fatty-acid--CoA ligase [Caulobacterales bacterium]|jgi:acyl-CoA synthetase (AMP-forming)/AMP-acid ligase II
MLDLANVKKVSDVVRVQARALANKPALYCDGVSLSYAELDKRSNQIARQLLAAGVPAQQRVGLLAKNGIPFYELLFGCAKARAALAPVNFRLAPPEIAAILADAGATLLFVGQDFYEVAEKALAGMENPPRVIALDAPHAGWDDYAAWRDAGLAHDPNLVELPSDDVIQLYTSGTTGLPKGVQLTNANYAAFMACAKHVEGFSYQPGESVMNLMPLFHVAGVNVGLMGLAQSTRIVIEKDMIPAKVLACIGEQKINHAFFAPAIILMLMMAPEMANADLTSMRTVSYGASPIAEDLLVKARARFGCGFLQFYGMTETAGAGTYLQPDAHDPALAKLRSCGKPWPQMDIKLAKANGEAVPVGEVGEVWIRGGMVMKGYWRRPEATAEAIVDGWMRTGDAAYQDADGYLFIHDRVKDMIVTGGENVYPAEVENALFGHPDLADVAIIGVPDDKWGEAVKAIAVLKPGVSPNPDSVVAWARERLANYKVPKSVDFVTTIPKNPSGKILRRELRKPYWEGRERQVN